MLSHPTVYSVIEFVHLFWTFPTRLSSQRFL